MVRIMDTSRRTGNKVVATIMADTKAEVTNNLTLGDNVLDFGSIALTVGGDVGLLDSEGVWHWQA